MAGGMASLKALATGVVLYSRIWLSGFADALRLHRCVVFFVYDPKILMKTVNCFVLNGVIFLGSVLLLDHALLPLQRLLLAPLLGPARAELLSLAFARTYHLLWLLPAYAISFLVNCIWYNEIAELVVAAAQRRLMQQRAQREGVVLPASEAVIKVSRPDLLAFLSQEVYRLLLTTALFLQVLVAGLVPGVGPALGFVGISWLYALYCFDYKWSQHGVPLEARLRFFEQHWAFFAGFGTVTVLPSVLGSFYTGAAAVGILFPLFIMMAADSNPKLRCEEVRCKFQGHPQLVRVPVLWVAVHMMNWVIARLAPTLATVGEKRKV